jgi:aldose 1-epimerase
MPPAPDRHAVVGRGLMRARAVWVALCGSAVFVAAAPEAPLPWQRKPFGRVPEGGQVELFTLSRGGVEARIAPFGAVLVSLSAPDRAGKRADVVLGFDALDGYLSQTSYFGVIVGRYANRIRGGRFTLGGVAYALARNDGENHLHGGVRHFGRVLWKARETTTPAGPGLELSHVSPDGDEGYPGRLEARVTYTLSEASELRIDFDATSDKDTIVNLAGHSYFNLAGQGEGDILGHELTIDADRFTPVGPGLIPTGELRSVAGTPFDFRRPTAIGARIGAEDPQLALGKGYDHNWVLNGSAGTLRLAARVREPHSGRVLELLTSEPGLQFYSGNFLDGSVKGKGGRAYPHRSGFCLEPQHFPDSPNQPSFPSAVLKRGERYRSTTVYRLATDKPSS